MSKSDSLGGSIWHGREQSLRTDDYPTCEQARNSNQLASDTVLKIFEEVKNINEPHRIHDADRKAFRPASMTLITESRRLTGFSSIKPMRRRC
jgi:hypothetical protein